MTNEDFENMLNKTYYEPSYSTKDKRFYPLEFIVIKRYTKIYFDDKFDSREVHKSWLLTDSLYIYDNLDECHLKCTEFNQELNKKCK